MIYLLYHRWVIEITFCDVRTFLGPHKIHEQLWDIGQYVRQIQGSFVRCHECFWDIVITCYTTWSFVRYCGHVWGIVVICEIRSWSCVRYYDHVWDIIIICDISWSCVIYRGHVWYIMVRYLGILRIDVLGRLENVSEHIR